MAKKEGLTYKDAGVDIFEEGEAIEQIWRLLPKTFALNPKVKFLPAISHYGGIVDIGMPNDYLVVTVDGVGSKVLIAEMLGKFDTVGIDCIAMNVNDLICVGAEPLIFVDYFAIEQPNTQMAFQIAKGLVEGATQARMAIIGGETATLPDIIRGVDGKGFDLAGTAIGLVAKEKLILGDKIRPGDAIFGIESSGLHSNGFSLVRKVLLNKYSITDIVEGVNLAEELLRPTAIYVQEVLELLNHVEIHGLANITGGAFLKLGRLLRQAKEEVGVLLDNLPEPPPIFQLIQKEGKISDEELYRTLNMGIGFCLIAPPSSFSKIQAICRKHHKQVYKIGTITAKKQITIQLPSETLEYPTDKY